MAEWTDPLIRTLIDERRTRNDEFHDLGRNRERFWGTIASYTFWYSAIRRFCRSFRYPSDEYGALLDRSCIYNIARYEILTFDVVRFGSSGL